MNKYKCDGCGHIYDNKIEKCEMCGCDKIIIQTTYLKLISNTSQDWLFYGTENRFGKNQMMKFDRDKARNFGEEEFVILFKDNSFLIKIGASKTQNIKLNGNDLNTEAVLKEDDKISVGDFEFTVKIYSK